MMKSAVVELQRHHVLSNESPGFESLLKTFLSLPKHELKKSDLMTQDLVRRLLNLIRTPKLPKRSTRSRLVLLFSAWNHPGSALPVPSSGFAFIIKIVPQIQILMTILDLQILIVTFCSFFYIGENFTKGFVIFYMR